MCIRDSFLYKLFGVDAELLIDHAWGRETATIAAIKSYKARTNSVSYTHLDVYKRQIMYSW